MLMPQNPKIAVIDDKYEEIEDIIQTFSKNGIPYIYLNGKREFLPNHSFESLRFIILDIDLGDLTASQTGNNLASVIATLVSNLIALKKQPYYIIFWTKNTDLCDKIIEYLKQEEKSPIGVLNWEKSDVISDCSQGKIDERLIKILQEDSYEYILAWENSITKYISSYSNSLCNINCRTEDWNQEFKNILSSLAISYTGRKTLEGLSSNEKVMFATEKLNRSFSNFVDSNLETTIDIPDKSNSDIHNIAKLNNLLFIEQKETNKIENGKVFFHDDEKLLLCLKKAILSQKKQDLNCQLIGVILTPSCDIAHDKYLKIDEGTSLHNILYGIKFEVGDDDVDLYFKYTEAVISAKEIINNSKLKEKDKNKLSRKIRPKKPDSLYYTSQFMDEGNKVSIFAFHFSTITTFRIRTDELNFRYILKNDLIADLQSKLANHINRLGNSMLEY